MKEKLSNLSSGWLIQAISKPEHLQREKRETKVPQCGENMKGKHYFSSLGMCVLSL